MMRHVLAHHGIGLVRGQPVGGKVERLIEAIDPLGPVPAQVRQIAHHLNGGVGQGQQRGIGRDYVVIRQAALEPQTGDAKGAVLVVLVGVEQVIARLGDAPGRPVGASVGDLVAHRALGAGLQQGAGSRRQIQGRHQVLEHGGAPGEKRQPALHPGHGASQLEPVGRRDLALGDGDERGDARL